MSCETCGHTMSRLGCQYSECAGTWACGRCGTLKIGHEDGHFDVIVPDLVRRCREFESKFGIEVAGRRVWKSTGCAEATHLPQDRRTDMMTEAEVTALMRSSTSPEEWDRNCDKVKAACNGYPPFWFAAVIIGGILRACKGLVELLDAHGWGEGPALREARAAIAEKE